MEKNVTKDPITVLFEDDPTASMSEDTLVKAGLKKMPVEGGNPNYVYYRNPNNNVMFVRLDKGTGYFSGKHPDTNEYSIEVDTVEELFNYKMFL